MTKKHFIELADRLRLPGHMEAAIMHAFDDLGEPYTTTLIHVIMTEVAHELANFCQEQNSKFDRERWLGYIAKGGGTKCLD